MPLTSASGNPGRLLSKEVPLELSIKDKKPDSWPCPEWRGGEMRECSRQKIQGVHRQVNEKA